MTAELAGRDAAHDLGQQIIDLLGIPKDQWEIAAQLEVMGLRDADAQKRMARAICSISRLAFTATIRTAAIAGASRGRSGRALAGRAVSEELRHWPDLSLPMALQAVTMLVWGYGVGARSRWICAPAAPSRWDSSPAYIVTGGFMQTIVRRGLFTAIRRNRGSRAGRRCARGRCRCASCSCSSCPRCCSMPVLDPAVADRLDGGGLLRGAVDLWLNWALLYLVRKTYLFLLTTAIALAMVLVAAKILQATPIAANAIGLFVADALSFGLALWNLNKVSIRRPVVIRRGSRSSSTAPRAFSSTACCTTRFSSPTASSPGRRPRAEFPAVWLLAERAL
jgi:hypothetical protein